MSEKLMYFLNVMSCLFLLSFIWLIGLLIGGIIFGFFPSTIAMINGIREVDFKDSSYIEIIKKYCACYLSSISNSKVFYIIFSMVNFCGLINLILVSKLNISSSLQIVFFISNIVILLYLLLTVICFTILNDCKLCVIMPLFFSIQSIISLIILGGFILIIIYFPFFIFFISFFFMIACKIFEDKCKKEVQKKNLSTVKKRNKSIYR